jgi:hypothetical protein
MLGSGAEGASWRQAAGGSKSSSSLLENRSSNSSRRAASGPAQSAILASLTPRVMDRGTAGTLSKVHIAGVGCGCGSGGGEEQQQQ